MSGAARPVLALLLAGVAVLPVVAGERAQQRLVERHAETIVFPAIIERCRDLPAFRDAPWAAELAMWRQRRAIVLDEARGLMQRLAEASGQTMAALDARIAQQVDARDAEANADTLAYTCERLRFTLRGVPFVPLHGVVALDEDSVREVLGRLLPVAEKLLPCPAVERIEVRPAPPPELRVDASSAAALADRVEMWKAVGCDRALDIEVSLRFPAGEPPTFALGFPRTAVEIR